MFGQHNPTITTLKVEIAGLAAEHATADDIENLQQIVTEMESVLMMPKQLASRDIDWAVGASCSDDHATWGNRYTFTDTAQQLSI
jgi:hypothetical protein